MRTFFYCALAIVVLLIGFSDPASAQETKGKVVIVPVADLYKAGNGGWTAHGINNVGIGERVVMEAFATFNTASGKPVGEYHDVGLTVNSATWTFTSVPATSALVNTDIVDTAAAGSNNVYVYFQPDVAGVYEVSMTAVTDSGNAIATAKITAAKYVGIGMYNRTTQSIPNAKCATCHSAITGDYTQTNHASAMVRKMETDGGHYADYCVRCHATGHNGGTNGGFDDYATALGFSIPPNHVGLWDSLYTAAVVASAGGNDSLQTMLGMANIQCENCHGPAGNHAVQGAIPGDPGFANKDYMYKSFDSGVCAPCHGAPDRHPRYIQWQASLHSKSYVNGSSPFYMNRGSCARCHVGQGFVDETINGIPAPSAGYEDPSTIGCVTCHDPHDKTGKQHQLRRLTARDACTGCHTTRLSSYSGLHHSHQGQMVQGTDTKAFDGDFSETVQDVSGWELPGYLYTNSAHSTIEERCVACHMAPSPSFDPTYGTKDSLSTKLGGHTWAIHWDGGFPDDESKHMINDTGCKSCHDGLEFGPVSLTMVHESQGEIKALLDTLTNYLPLRSPTQSNPNLPKFPQDNSLTPIQKAAAYNWWFVNNDGSFGVHNHAYAKQLLESSLEQVKLGAGAAAIASIADVPGDQGHRVQVVWNKFPAESFSYNPVVNYGVWREDPQIGTKVTPKKNYTEMFQTATVGQQYSVSGLVWTYVANVPASDFAMYSYIAETLMDSSAGGAATTNFKVVGYSFNNASVYSSQPLAGYSVDNLPPLRVVEFAVNVGTNGATLTWKPNPEDMDVVNFLVYRGTTPNFTPGTPLTETTDRSFTDGAASGGTAYWYIIQAVDNAGNKGELSSPMGTTNVEQTDGLPTTFALGQNYPNPFNPSTTINFALPEAGTVVLSVYTISGELVNTLAQGEFPAGNFKVIWTGTDGNGAQVATGMYLYRIQSGSFTSVKKMILLK
jgi:predicted CXXCH cytochrome family protein